MKHAILIMMHKNPEQVSRLIKCFPADRCVCFVHLDKKANFDCDELRRVLQREGARAVVLNKRISGVLTTFSLVDIALELIRAAKEYEKKENVHFDYMRLVSGQDYPIKSFDEYDRYVEERYPTEFINAALPENASHVRDKYSRWRWNGVREFAANHLKADVSKHGSSKQTTDEAVINDSETDKPDKTNKADSMLIDKTERGGTRDAGVSCKKNTFKNAAFDMLSKILIGCAHVTEIIYTRMVGSPAKVLTKKGYRISGGGAWWTLTDEFTDYIMASVDMKPRAAADGRNDDYESGKADTYETGTDDSDKDAAAGNTNNTVKTARDLAGYARRIATPEEVFFQLLYVNSQFYNPDNPVGNDLTFGNYGRGDQPRDGHTYAWHSENIDELLSSDRFFARKFEPSEDEKVLDLLDEAMGINLL